MVDLFLVRLKDFAHAHLLNIMKETKQSLFKHKQRKTIENCIRLRCFALIIKNTIIQYTNTIKEQQFVNKSLQLKR